jgi:oligosaccharide repeat unit polymerase
MFYHGFLSSKPLLSIEIIILLLYGILLIIKINNTQNSLIDIRLIAIISYILYSIYTPVVYLIYNKSYYFRLAPYLTAYNYSDITKTVFISILFLIGFSIPIIVSKESKQVKPKEDKNIKYKKASFYLWLIISVLAFLWYIYPYIYLGLKDALNYDRGYRYLLFTNIYDSLGGISKILNLALSQYVILISFPMLFRRILLNKGWVKEKIIFFLYITIVCIFFLFIDGRRREVMYIIMMCFSYYIISSNKKINLKDIMKYSIYLILIAAFFISYQYFRNYFTLAAKEGVKYAIDAKRQQDTRLDKEYKLYGNEFGMVYENILSAVKYTPKPMLGKTYIEAIIAPIPIINRIIYYNDQTKIPLIGKWYSKLYPKIFDTGGGLGFSPAAESYLNLGFLGCILYGILFGFLFNAIYYKLCNNTYAIYYCLLLPQGWNFSRISSLGVTKEIFWYVFYYIFYSILIEIFARERKESKFKNE